ncbi:MAG: RNA methyltransferase [Anaerolineae bacterium]|nr:RNA methyltransferase [Anaerolineae bacterium]
MITSLSNERVKKVIGLQARRNARRKAGLFVIEGTRLVRDAVEAGVPITEVFYTEEYGASEEGRAVLDAASDRRVMLLAVDEPVMKAMSDTETPQGILVTLPLPQLEVPEDYSFALIIDGVSNPGNMGTIMRAAASAGVPVMMITSGTVDLTNPKVIRSAMGAHFRLPVQALSWQGIANRLADKAIFLADIKNGSSCYQVDWTQPCALIVSDEAHGASQEAVELAHAYVTIPMPGQMESLNVAMASSILLFEMVRQRTYP